MGLIHELNVKQAIEILERGGTALAAERYVIASLLKELWADRPKPVRVIFDDEVRNVTGRPIYDEDE